MNGGSDCLGDPEQTNECPLDCHLDGYWFVFKNSKDKYVIGVVKILSDPYTVLTE